MMEFLHGFADVSTFKGAVFAGVISGLISGIIIGFFTGKAVYQKKVSEIDNKHGYFVGNRINSDDNSK